MRALPMFVLAAVLLTGGTASAHPQGQKPVALVTAEGSTVRVVWIVATDDLEALAGSLGLETVALPALDDEPAFRSYVDERARAAVGEAGCPGRIDSIERVGRGFALDLRYACPARADSVTLRIGLLHDVSPDYVTLMEATTAEGRVRDVFRAGADTVTVDFARGSASKPAGTVGEGRIGRISGLLEGGPAGVSLWVGVALAFALGAVHAVTPGHGKTITAAYLVGEGGTVRQALGLAGVVTLTHALSVAVLGAVAIRLDELLLPSAWGPWLEVAAGLVMVAMGIGFWRGVSAHHHHGHRQAGMPLGRLALVGLVGGLVPSPEAIGIVLVAFSLGRWEVGMLLVVAFSLGLAGVVLAVAFAAVRAGPIVRRALSGRGHHLAPRIAASVFVAMGALVAVRGALGA